MNKTELVNAIYEANANDFASKAAAARVVDSIIKLTNDTVAKGEKITIPGFVTVSVAKRAARTGQNPQTGEKIKIKAANVVKFKAGSALKESAAKAKIK